MAVTLARWTLADCYGMIEANLFADYSIKRLSELIVEMPRKARPFRHFKEDAGASEGGQHRKTRNIEDFINIFSSY